MIKHNSILILVFILAIVAGACTRTQDVSSRSSVDSTEVAKIVRDTVSSITRKNNEKIETLHSDYREQIANIREEIRRGKASQELVSQVYLMAFVIVFLSIILLWTWRKEILKALVKKISYLYITVRFSKNERSLRKARRIWADFYLKKQNRYSDLLVKYGRLQEEYDSLLGLYNAKVNERVEKSPLYAEALARVTKAEASVKELGEKVEAERAAKEKLESEKNKIKQQLDIVNKNVQAERAAKHELEHEKNTIKQQLEVASKKIEMIRDEVTSKKDAEKKKLERELENTNQRLNETKASYERTKTVLESTQNSLSERESEVERLQVAQSAFTEQLTSVQFAQEYAQHIEALEKVVKEILLQADALLKVNLSDPYHLMKAMAKYTAKIHSMDQNRFVTDVAMAAKSHFAFTDSTLATFNQNDNVDNLNISTKQYFFENYLKTYIDAAMVLNESLAGLHYLINDLSADRCKVFTGLRHKLVEATELLGIKVISVKLFEMAGEKVDLQIETVDTGIGITGQILEIGNSQVTLIGSNMPAGKISVKVES